MSQRTHHIARAWSILEERELSRSMYARQLGTGPEQVFYSTKAARARANVAANRYSNVLPYDRAAVATEEGAYVNASVVRAGGEWWVAAQAPVPDNFAAFFRAILYRTASQHPLITPLRPKKSNHAILVQLTGWSERGSPKADDYMPKDSLTFHHPVGNVHLDRKTSLTKPNLGAEYTEMILADVDSAMTVHHYFYGAWPDHGVPEGKALAQLRGLVREVRQLAEKEGCEVWVHCSAGVGRTGTFIMLLSMLDRPPSKGEDEAPFKTPLGDLKMEPADPIARRVDAIREYRCMLVQTPQQLALLYTMMGV